MSFNKISRARNLLKEARAAVGEIRLDHEAYGKPFVILLTETYADLGEAIAILEAPPPKPRAVREAGPRGVGAPSDP